MVMFSRTQTAWYSITKKIEDFHSRTITFKQRINHSVETVSSTRLLFKYTILLSKIYKLKAFIAPKMTDFITFLDKNRKYAVYTGGNIHGLYFYLEIIETPTTLTTSGQQSHHFGP